MVLPFGGGTDPEVEGDVLGSRSGGGAIAGAPAFADPDVDLLDRSDRAALDDLDAATVVRARVVLRAHLRRALVLLRQRREDARLAHGVGQWLLAVDVPARAQGRRARRGVCVIRRRDDDGLDVLLVEEL